MSELAHLSFDETGPAVVTRLEGEIDASNADQVGEDALAAVRNDALGLVLDLTGVRYVDSAGIQMLFDLAERLERRRQRLALVVPEDLPILQMLTVTGMQSVVPIAPTRAEADAALRRA
jgi:anti-anti-sigma factor